MAENLQNTLALLERTPRALDALLRDLPDHWIHANEGEGTWSPFQIVEHLLLAEANNWMVRARWLLEHGDSKPFAPFAREEKSEKVKPSLGTLLSDFQKGRAQNLRDLQQLNLSDADLARRGCHPDFGPVTLGQLLSTWVTHDLTHLHQLSRVLAFQNRNAVGPWIKFLGVLKCNAHGE